MHTSDNIDRKFESLHRKKIPTGDPLISEEVDKAKHIRYKVTELPDIGVREYATGEAFFLDDEVDPCARNLTNVQTTRQTRPVAWNAGIVTTMSMCCKVKAPVLS